MPFKTYNNWLFDGKRNTSVPSELLKSNCPVSQIYALRMFILNGELNNFLNTYMNNVGLWYIEKEELFKFFKQCVLDFKVKKNSIPFIRSKKNKDKLFNILREKIVVLKDSDIVFLCDIIEKSDDKEKIYSSLGIDKPKKTKVKPKKKKKKEEKNSLDDFISENFRTVRVEKK